ncbi:hypothetical protein ASG58_11095 [Rhizobium sp. Leaf383]|nr:hypothetical protein ASG58_11095 [Rhizobium sp. Leaf383]
MPQADSAAAGEILRKTHLPLRQWFQKAKASLEFEQGQRQSLGSVIRSLMKVLEAQRVAWHEQRDLENKAAVAEDQIASVELDF